MIHPARTIARGLWVDRCNPEDRRGCPEPDDDAGTFAALVQFGSLGASIAATAAVTGGHNWPPPDGTTLGGEK